MRVAILGGGVAGMSAAHELVERGFDVEVHERRAVAGGKARSIPAKNGDVTGLPGEHGFRFFPGFYRHLPDTMKRIPFGGQRNGVAGNLVETTDSELAVKCQPPIIVPDRFPLTLRDLWRSRHFFDFLKVGVTVNDMMYFMERLFVLQASCTARRFEEWEYTSWWDFSGAANRSPAYGQFLADGMTRKLVAARAREASTRTMGYILLQLLRNLTTPGAPMDRLLNGPTSAVWIDPWLDHLRRKGVNYRTDSKLVKINLRTGNVDSVIVQKGDDPQTRETVKADYYVVAVPVEIMRCLVEEDPALEQADPQLALLRNLQVRWMNGIQFYLKRDVPLARGHTIYGDSPWSLTSVSQRQFWPTTFLTAIGQGQCQGVLSVDISDWETPGCLYSKPAKELSRAQIKEEVWHQMKAHLNVDGNEVLEDRNLLGWFLDPDIRGPNPQGVDANLEPLLVNTTGSWFSRPDAVTSIRNMFLASDYVQTFTDLATMEGANEAARRAVNGILDASGSRRRRCDVWAFPEPIAFAPLRSLDAIRFRRRIPPGPCPPDGAQAVLTPDDCEGYLDDEPVAAESADSSAADSDDGSAASSAASAPSSTTPEDS